MWLLWAPDPRLHPGRQTITLGELVVGVLASVALDFGTEHARSRLGAAVALGAFAVGMAGVNVLWAVLGALIAGVAGMRGKKENDGVRTPEAARRPISWRALAVASVPGLVVAAGVIAAALAPGALAGVSADMAKIGSIAFGNGLVILPVLQQDALAHHWVTLSQFGAGVAFGQVTPGPFLVTAAFVGFAAAGWPGGVAGGIAVFAPSVALTMIVGEIYSVLRGLSWVRGAIAGVMAGFTGLLASMVLTLGRPVLSVPAALGLAAAAFIAVRVYRLPTIVVFAAGLGIWAVYLAAGGPR